jgi:cell division septation protein DedD
MKQGGGGDRVVESRHVVGMFLGVVVLCGIFFTLGYVMGRTQYDSSVRAATLAASERPVAIPKQVENVPAPAPQWDFMKPSSPAETSKRLETASKPADVSAPAKPAEKPAEKPAAAEAKSRNPLVRTTPVPRGNVVLQLAALRSEYDALALTEALQQKNFPAFVLMPATGDLYRVQVGPFSSVKDAESTKKALEREGFRVITKR